MKKFLLFGAMFAFIASSFAQKDVDRSLKAFQLNANHTIYSKNISTQQKSINANLSESFNVFPPNSWSAAPATGYWEGSATWQYASTAANYGDGVFAVMDCFNLNNGEEGSLITPVLNPVAGNNTLSYDVIEMLLNSQYIGAGMQLFIEFSTDGGTNWTTSTTNVLEGITDHNTATVAQTPTTLTEDLSAYNDQSVQIRFRCISDYGGFSMFLDNVTGPDATINMLTNDLALNHAYLSATGFDYYSIIPISQFGNVQVKASVSNLGSADQTNVAFNVTDAANSINLSSTPQTVATTVTDTLVVDITAPTTATSYTLATNVSQTETDENIDNNKGDTIRFSADPTNYFRSMSLNSILTSYSFGASAPATTGMEFGANYLITADTRVDSISMIIYGANGTGNVVGRLYSVDPSTGDRTLLGETSPYTPAGTPELKNMNFTTPIAVTAGQILTATAQLNIDVNANDTIKIGSDGSFVGDAAVAGAAYIQVGGTFGWYTVTGTVANVGLIINDNPLSVENRIKHSEINVYPNPTTGLVKIEGVEGAQIIIYNMIGEIVYNEANASATTTIDLSSFNAGNYIIKIINNNEVSTQKIVLTK